jgi:membrane-bound lytic murein transglycosylase F
MILATRKLAVLAKDHPGLTWQVEEEASTPELIQALAEKKFDCTVVDDQIRRIYHRYYPRLRVVLTLGSEESAAWVLPSESSKLKNEIEKWFKATGQKQAENLGESHFSIFRDFDPYDIRKFNERVESRLPKYEKWLQQAAARTGWIGNSWPQLATKSRTGTQKRRVLPEFEAS